MPRVKNDFKERCLESLTAGLSEMILILCSVHVVLAIWRKRYKIITVQSVTGQCEACAQPVTPHCTWHLAMMQV